MASYNFIQAVPTKTADHWKKNDKKAERFLRKILEKLSNIFAVKEFYWFQM